MRVLIVSAVFPPEPVLSSQTSADIALECKRRGHCVSVVSPFPSRPAGVLYNGYRRRLFSDEDWHGISVNRTWSTISKTSSVPSRALENLSFGLSSALRLLVVEQADVIYANTWPIFASGLLALSAYARNIPVVMSVQDLYPESLIAQSRMNSGGLFKHIATTIDRAIARSCSRLVLISERFLNVYRDQRLVAADRLVVIPNWVDPTLLPPVADELQARRRWGIPDRDFLLVYSGNVGVASGLPDAMTALARLNPKNRCCIFIAGAGSELDRCRSIAHTLTNVRVLFHSPYPAEDTATVLGMADALLLPTKGAQSFASVPSKLIWYMLSGKPVIALAQVDSDLASIINHARCGWIVSPGDASEIAATVSAAASASPHSLQEMGSAGRHYAMERFAKDKCLPKLVDVLEEAAKHR